MTTLEADFMTFCPNKSFKFWNVIICGNGREHGEIFI